ncbi:MAG: hypothetical protein ABS80_22850 [Pseudonocardia sp. SCN 72-51]|nr:MAG: hypothetical protein ABS80_22850 [Pseudonocardia sp. SCN 72-51]
MRVGAKISTKVASPSMLWPECTTSRGMTQTSPSESTVSSPPTVNAMRPLVTTIVCSASGWVCAGSVVGWTHRMRLTPISLPVTAVRKFPGRTSRSGRSDQLAQ